MNQAVPDSTEVQEPPWPGETYRASTLARVPTVATGRGCVTAPKLARPARPGEPGFKTGARVYEHPITHAVVPSITAVNSMIDKTALKFWAARQAAEYAVADWDALTSVAPGERVDLIRNAPWRTTATAADAGDIVHNAIDAFIKTGRVPMSGVDWPITAKRMWRAFAAFCKVYEPQWVDAEFTVWSDRYGYAGTMDWSARIGEWLVLGDTKTGKGVYPEVGLQIAAGAFADYIIDADGSQKPIPQFDRFAVLHVRPTYATLHPLSNIGQCFDAFKAARQLKFWKDEVADNIIGEAPRVSVELKEAA